MTRPGPTAKLRSAWNTVQVAAGLGTALLVLIVLTPLARGHSDAKMTGIAPPSAPASSARVLDGQRLPAPADKTGAHETHITDAH